MRDYSEYLSEFEDERGGRRRPKAKRKPKRSHAEAVAELVEPGSENVERGFNPSFRASRHERAWILTYLGPFYDDHLIADVLRPVKGGKEATVYCCRAHPSTGVELLAAKVYRPRIFRTLRNDALYREGRHLLDDQGRAVRDRRGLRAVAKKTGRGQTIQHTSWLAHEFETMRVLSAAGADVPKPVALGENAILMGYVGDEVRAAATLNHVRLARDEAPPLFRRLMDNVALMLAHGRVHGDLSAYNVLYWEGEVTIIDFPQAVDASTNPQARTLFERDVTRLCQYFARYGVEADPVGLAADLWSDAMPDAGEEWLMEEAPWPTTS